MKEPFNKNESKLLHFLNYFFSYVGFVPFYLFPLLFPISNKIVLDIFYLFSFIEQEVKRAE